MPKALLKKLPDKARDIYEAAWEEAQTAGHDDETAAKIAIGAVKRAGYSKDDKTDMWTKMHMVHWHITKATLDEGVMRWQGTVSKFAVDVQGDEITPKFIKYAWGQVQKGHRPAPVVCVSHIDHGQPSDAWVAGDADAVYTDGQVPKAKGTFRDTPLGKAAFAAVVADIQNDAPQNTRARFSMGFYDEGSRIIKSRRSDGEQVAGRRYHAGWIKHLALTRLPVVRETSIQATLEEKGMTKAKVTKRDDAATIVGDELADELAGVAEKADLEDTEMILKQEQEADLKAKSTPADETPLAEGETSPPTDSRQDKSVSIEDFSYRVREAWGDQFPTDQSEMAIEPERENGGWVREVMDDAVIVRRKGALYKTTYVVDAETGGITFGAPMKIVEIKTFVPEEAAPGVTQIPRVNVKADLETDPGVTRRDQVKALLASLETLLLGPMDEQAQETNRAALGNPGSNPPTTVEMSTAVATSPPTDAQPAQQKAQTGETVNANDAAAMTFVDDWAMRVKAVLVGDQDRTEKFSTLQHALNEFGEGVKSLVTDRTPASGRDMAEVIQEAVRMAVEPVYNELASVKAELAETKQGQKMPGAQVLVPQPRAMDGRAVVMPDPNQPTSMPPGIGQGTALTQKAMSASQLAWQSTAENANPLGR